MNELPTGNEITPAPSSKSDEIIRNWRQQETDFQALEDNVEQTRLWVRDFGQLQEREDYSVYVYPPQPTAQEPDTNGFVGVMAEATDAEGDPESVDILKERMLLLSDSTNERAVELSFYKSLDDTNDESEVEIAISVLYKIPPSQKGNDNLVEFPRRAAHLLSGDELLVAETTMDKFKKMYIAPQQGQ